MATLKYKTPEGEWKKVSIGGGGSTEEVYVGSDTPPKGAKVWIDPTGTPSQPSTPSAGVEVIDNLESDSTTAALSANQGRVLKEMIGQGGASGGGTYYIPVTIWAGSASSPYGLSNEEYAAFKSFPDIVDARVVLLVEGVLLLRPIGEAHIAEGDTILHMWEFISVGRQTSRYQLTKFEVTYIESGNGISAYIEVGQIANINY